MTVTTTNNLQAILIDPEDQGFYKSRMQQWATICPHMNATEHRVFSLLVDLCSAQATYRVLTLADLAEILPTKAVKPCEEPQMMSVSTIARTINALSALGQVTDENGGQLRISNGKSGQVRIAPWRSLRHDCTASRNVYDALDRTQGKDGRHPIGLGLAQNSVPELRQPDLVDDQPDLVDDQPDLVDDQPDLVDATSKTPASTRGNYAPQIPSPSPSLSPPPPSPTTPDREAPSESSVARIGEGGLAAPEKQGSAGPLDHSLAAVALVSEIPKGAGIETGKVIAAITRRLDEGLTLETVRRELLKPLPRRVRSLTGLYLGRLAALTGDESAESPLPAVAPRPDAHTYVDRYGSCDVCGLVEDNPRHRVLAAAQTA